MNRVEQHIENYFSNLSDYEIIEYSILHKNFTYPFKDIKNKKILTIYRNRVTASKKFANGGAYHIIRQKWKNNIVKYDKFFIEKIKKILKLHQIRKICFIWNEYCTNFNDNITHRPHTYIYKNNKWQKEKWN